MYIYVKHKYPCKYGCEYAISNCSKNKCIVLVSGFDWKLKQKAIIVHYNLRKTRFRMASNHLLTGELINQSVF